MKSHELVINHFDDILPMLSGKVFHVTPTSNIPLIKECEAIIPNTELLYTSKFGNVTNGFFRKRGCVSFFDYRCFGTPHWKKHAYKCSPTQILEQCDSISILFLSEDEYSKLIPWTVYQDQKAWSERVVPWIEAGYKGSVSLNCITEELTVRRSSSNNKFQLMAQLIKSKRDC